MTENETTGRGVTRKPGRKSEQRGDRSTNVLEQRAAEVDTMLDEGERALLSRLGTKAGTLQRAALDYLREKEAKGEIPTSGHFLFYELEQRGIVSKKPKKASKKPKKAGEEEKKGRKPTQDLTDAVKRLRDVGLIPWNWIEDDSRRVHAWRHAESVAAYVAESVDRARIDPWTGVRRPVILCESRTTGGVFARGIAYDYLCTVAPTNGQCGGFLVTGVAPLLKDDDTRVLYFGDYDLAGGQIEANTRRVLERHTGRTFDEDTWERVALTEDQVADLATRGVEPILKTDDRYTDGHPHEAYECEALGQGPIVELLRARLDELLPEPLEDVLEREREQREQVRKALKRIARNPRAER